MERAQPEIVAALLLQLHIAGNDIHDVISGTHFFYYFLRIVHEAPLLLSDVRETLINLP
jgi:hypothetical protein